MTSTTTDQWSEPVTRRIFGIVPDEAVRRHPSELWRIGASVVIVAITAVMALHVSKLEKAAYALIADIPEGLRDGFWVTYILGTVGVLIGLTVSVLVARRWRFALILIAAGVVAFGLGVLLQAVVGSEAVRQAAGLDDPATPTYPVILVAVSTAVILVASSYLTRTARHLVVALLIVACLSATLLTLGLSADVIGALALGWGVAAAVRFTVGSPAGTPSVAEVASALAELGIRARDLDLTPEQVWGEVRYTAVEELPDGDVGEPLSIVVIGRDASDARLFSKLWRFLWYKDSGPEVSITRLGQLERRAYLLLLAAQAGIPAEHVVAAGTAGEDEDAVLVLREPSGVRLPALAADDADGRRPGRRVDDGRAAAPRSRRARHAHGRQRPAPARRLGRAHGLLASEQLPHGDPARAGSRPAPLDDRGIGGRGPRADRGPGGPRAREPGRAAQLPRAGRHLRPGPQGDG